MLFSYSVGILVYTQGRQFNLLYNCMLGIVLVFWEFVVVTLVSGKLHGIDRKSSERKTRNLMVFTMRVKGVPEIT